MTTPTPKPVKQTDREPCCCGDGKTAIDAERLRKLREGLTRNTTAVARIIEQILAELDEKRRSA